MGTAEKIHSWDTVKRLKAHLRKSLPGENKQKTGITAVVVQRMVQALEAAHGAGCVHAAVVLLMWAALLRPGEAVVTQRHPQWDISRHLAHGDVQFWDGDVQRWPRDGKGVPSHMRICIKDSKTDHWRMTKDMVVGATGLRHGCPVAAMWAWVQSTGVTSAVAPLFTLGGQPMRYAQLRAMVKWALQRAGVPDVASYGCHSFRVGGAQALAMAGKSTAYIMSMGRWRCVESVLTYVETPLQYRVRDAKAMMTALPGRQADQAVLATSAREIVAASVAQAARLRSR